MNATNDFVCLDIPLLTRILEECREGISSDAELHFLLESMIEESKATESILTMDNYANIMKFREKFALYKDQLEYADSFADDDEEDDEDYD